MTFTKQELISALERAYAEKNVKAANEIAARLTQMEAAEAAPAQAQQTAITPDLQRSAAIAGGMALPPAPLRQAADIAAGMGIRGGAQAAGAALGAIPPVAAATGGMSIPVGAALGAMAGEYIEGARQGQRPTAGQVAGAGVAGAFLPGGNAALSGSRGLAREIGRSGMANLAGKQAETLIDEGRSASLGEGLLASGTGMAAPVIGRAVGKAVGVDGRSAAEISRAKREAARLMTFDAAMKEGYKLDPSLSNANLVNSAAVHVAGQSALQRELSKHNQQVTNAIARRELGLGPDKPLDALTMEARRLEMSQPYKEIEKISPAAASLLEEVKSLRSDARKAWANWRNSNGDVRARNEAVALEKQASIAEDSLDKIVQKTNNPGLIQDFRDARVNLAKWHAVDDSINYSVGDVNASILGAKEDASRGLLTDGLKTVAQISNAMPHVIKESASIGSADGRNTRLGLVMIAGGIGAQAAGLPGGLAAAGLAFAGDVPTRAFLQSRAYQESMARPFYQRPRPSAAEQFVRYTTAAGGR